MAGSDPVGNKLPTLRYFKLAKSVVRLITDCCSSGGVLPPFRTVSDMDVAPEPPGWLRAAHPCALSRSTVHPVHNDVS
jgi:hypothetical protein